MCNLGEHTLLKTLKRDTVHVRAPACVHACVRVHVRKRLRVNIAAARHLPVGAH